MVSGSISIRKQQTENQGTPNSIECDQTALTYNK